MRSTVCGIAGYVSSEERSGPELRAIVELMLSTERHRGPDGEGIWAAAGGRVCFGHRRLAVIDLSPGGRQPMLLPARGLTITFNGEIYNYLELRSELEAGGAVFASKSDTEVLLHAYARWGTAMLGHLVGMFAFAIWDERRGELFLARDRAGEKPLYFAAMPRAFAFASEIQAVACVPGVDDTLDRDALALYLEYQSVPSPRSIYRGIEKLSPAHAMVLSLGGLRKSWRYWDPVTCALQPRLRLDAREATGELERRLKSSIRGQMLADVPLGAFLSGGIDSSTVVSLMQELSSSRVRTFTIGFDVEEFDESKQSEQVARYLGTEHTVEYLTERDALDLVPRIPAMYGEPFADSSALPTHLVSCVARKSVTVALSGDGGDEAFGGYTRYAELLRRTRRIARPVRMPLRAVRPFVPGRPGRIIDYLAKSDRDLFRGTLTAMPGADVRRLVGLRCDLPEYERAWNQAIAGGAHRRAMLADMLTYLPDTILAKVDRAAMAISLETRAPILDHRVLEFALRLPPKLVRGKFLLKALAYARIPRPLLDRPKMGFGVPMERWFRGKLRGLLEDALAPSELVRVGIADSSAVQGYIRDHLAGRANHQARLWALLVLSLWDRHRRDQRSATRTAEMGVAV